MRWSLDVPHTLLEGSAALGIAALRGRAVEVDGRNVAVVTTGRNIGPDLVRRVLAT
jgi:threonine dehydratase